MIISVVAAKIWYLKKCTVFIGPPCIFVHAVCTDGSRHDGLGGHYTTDQK